MVVTSPSTKKGYNKLLNYKRNQPMMEIEQLKKRINDSGVNGVELAHIRDDYEPAGDMMIRYLTDSDEYVQRKTPAHNFDQKWCIFKRESKPY